MRDENDAAEKIIAMERNALDRWGKGDPSGFLEISAQDVVYFDPYLERRLDGIGALSRYYESLRGKVNVERYELINPAVQLCNTVAVLTFNYVSYIRETESHWNCTEVYRHTGGQWRIIQTHWSLSGKL